MKKLALLLGIMFAFNVILIANPIDEMTARQVGRNFMASMGIIQPTEKNLVLDLSYKSSSVSFNSVNADLEETIYFYIFNSQSGGFVIVSGDDDVIPILGYSSEGEFESVEMPDNFLKWLEDYKSEIRFILENEIKATQEIADKWTTLKNGIIINDSPKLSVSPLVQTKWNQAPYYNAMCPNNSVTGCVATAMAQIMKYWNYPEQGIGFHSYNHQNYGTISANFGSTTYNWNAMPNTVNSNNTAVATLMYHCGVSVNMQYSPEVSGAFVIENSPTPQACSEYALKTYFGYKNSLSGKERVNYTEANWINLLKTELNSSRPVLYAGFGSGGGHCFVSDGYDNNDFFHFNWGWGGVYDGYFTVNALNPDGVGIGGGNGGFNSGQQVVIGIEPSSNDGGSNPGNEDLSTDYSISLYSNLLMPQTTLWFIDPISLTTQIANYGTNNFTGNIGAAVFDENLNFIDFISTLNGTLESNYYYEVEFNNPGSPTFVPGIYYAAIFYKTASSDWTIVGDGDYNNIIQFEIIYSAPIETNSNFSITSNGGSLIQGLQANINVDILNTGNNTFYGSYRIDLANLDGTYVQTIQTLNENNGLPYGYHYTGGVDFSGVISAPPGTYLLELGYANSGTNDWYYAGSSNYQNPIYVIVEASPLSPDMYEVNNTVAQAYNFNLNFNGNIAQVKTTGSNLHTGSDIDYYKFTLPTNNQYTISARVHDAYNSGNGNTYSVDALWAYSTDGGQTWSDSYDDINNQNISLNGGQTIYFVVAPYFAGETGTYLLDVKATKGSGPSDIAYNESLQSIATYPNPAQDFIKIDSKHFNGNIEYITILNSNGQIIKKENISSIQDFIQINLNDLSSDNYLLRIQTSQGILTRKIIKIP